VEVCDEEVNLTHVGDESWLLDSGASVHICKDRRMFDNYKQVYGIRIKTADGRSKPLLAEGSGTVRIKLGGRNVRLAPRVPCQCSRSRLNLPVQLSLGRTLLLCKETQCKTSPLH
jgi:hypothetical protein